MVASIPSKTYTRSDLEIRLARPEDRAALEAISAQIWGGDDYLPRVLDGWLADGGFYVATLRDQVVGVSKMTRLGDGEWWMEGLRVDPAYQKLGIARIMHHYLLNQLHQHETGVVRFSTEAGNDAVHRLAAETGFERLAVLVEQRADALPEPVQSWKVLSAADAPRVREWLNASPYYVQAARSYEKDWSFYLLTDERLSERLKAGLVYEWPGGGCVLLNAPVQERWAAPDRLKAAYLDVPLPELTAAALDLRRVAAALNREAVNLKIVKQPERSAAFEAAGYSRPWEGETALYAREISLTQNVEVRTEELPPVE